MICGCAATRSGARPTKSLKAASPRARRRRRRPGSPRRRRRCPGRRGCATTRRRGCPPRLAPRGRSRRPAAGHSSVRSGRTGNLTTMRITGSSFTGGSRRPLQQAELVALRVGQHVPALLAGLPDVGRRRRQAEQASSSASWSRSVALRSMCSRSLPGVGSGTGPNTSVGAGPPKPSSGPISTAPFVPREHPVVEDGGPERGERLRVAAVDDEFAEAAGHGATLAAVRGVAARRLTSGRAHRPFRLTPGHVLRRPRRGRPGGPDRGPSLRPDLVHRTAVPAGRRPAALADPAEQGGRDRQELRRRTSPR